MLSKKNILILLSACLLIPGLIALYLEQDISYDLLNYHFYIGYSLLHLNLKQDFYLSNFMGYTNPTLDALNYLIITHFAPLFTGFLMGAIQGFNFFLIALLSGFYLKRLEPSYKYQIITMIMILLLSLMGANVLREIGTFYNDLTLSSLVILALLINTQIFFKNEKLTDERCKIFIAGICLGVSVGFKLTMSIYGLGATLAFLALENNLRTKILLLASFVLGMVIGFLLINGYWMMLLWINFKNPFFPFFNKIFKSSFFYDFNISNYEGAKRFPEIIFYPFYCVWNGKIGVKSIQDSKMAIDFLLLVVLLIKKIFGRESNYLDFGFKNSKRYFITFFIISYILWQYQFSIARYMIVLDLLSPLLIYLLLQEIFKNSDYIKIYCLIIFALIIVTTKPTQWARIPWTKNNYFDVDMPKISNFDKPTIVLKSQKGDTPTAFLRPLFPKEWHFIGIDDIGPDKYWDLFLKKIPNLNDYQWFMLFSTPPKTEWFETFGKQAPEPCYIVTSRLGKYVGRFYLCKILPIRYLH